MNYQHFQSRLKSHLPKPPKTKIFCGVDYAPQILDRLLTMLTDPEEYMRRSAADAVGNLGSRAATPQILTRLADLLTDSDEYVRSAAVEAFKRLQPQRIRIFR